jgi:hypothetical protein
MRASNLRQTITQPPRRLLEARPSSLTAVAVGNSIGHVILGYWWALDHTHGRGTYDIEA